MKRYKEEIEQIKAILNAGLLQWKNKRFTLNQLAEKIDDETTTYQLISKYKNLSNDFIPNYFLMKEFEKHLEIDFSKYYPNKDAKILEFIYCRQKKGDSLMMVGKEFETSTFQIIKMEESTSFENLSEKQKEILETYLKKYGEQP